MSTFWTDDTMNAGSGTCSGGLTVRWPSVYPDPMLTRLQAAQRRAEHLANVLILDQCRGYGYMGA
jgi:hypothetical protein